MLPPFVFIAEADASDSMRAWFEMLFPLARYMAHRYEFQYHQPHDEFLSVALEGAWRAACTFCQMGTRGGLAEVETNDDGVPIGLYQWGRIKIKGAIIDAARDEMRQHGCSRKESSRFETLSLDQPWDNDGERTLGETLEDPRSESGFEQIEEHAALLTLRDRLTPKEWDILTRWADGQPMKSIGLEYGVTESRICQLMSKITAKARRILREEWVASADPRAGLSPEAREALAEGDWLSMLSASEVREAERLEKVRSRYSKSG